MSSHKGTLVQHVNSVQEDPKLFTCEMCKKTFSKKEFLSIHVKSVHENLKPYKCDICDGQNVYIKAKPHPWTH